MPVDFSSLLGTNKITITKADNFVGLKGGIRTNNSNAMAVDVIKILQDSFPQYLDTNAKVTSTLPDDGNTAQYSPFSNTISAGRVIGDRSTYIDSSGKSRSDLTDAYVTKQGIQNNVSTLLHELYHARITATGTTSYDYSVGGVDWKRAMSDAQKSNFPSVDTSDMASTQLEEFFATATSIDAMRHSGMQLTGRQAELAKNLDAMKSKYPWLQRAIGEQSQPENIKSQQVLGTDTAKAADDNHSVLSSIIDIFK